MAGFLRFCSWAAARACRARERGRPRDAGSGSMHAGLERHAPSSIATRGSRGSRRSCSGRVRARRERGLPPIAGGVRAPLHLVSGRSSAGRGVTSNTKMFAARNLMLISAARAGPTPPGAARRAGGRWRSRRSSRGPGRPSGRRRRDHRTGSARGTRARPGMAAPATENSSMIGDAEAVAHEADHGLGEAGLDREPARQAGGGERPGGDLAVGVAGVDADQRLVGDLRAPRGARRRRGGGPRAG